jgi:hypothetical protein
VYRQRIEDERSESLDADVRRFPESLSKIRLEAASFVVFTGNKYSCHFVKKGQVQYPTLESRELIVGVSDACKRIN